LSPSRERMRNGIELVHRIASSHAFRHLVKTRGIQRRHPMDRSDWNEPRNQHFEDTPSQSRDFRAINIHNEWLETVTLDFLHTPLEAIGRSLWNCYFLQRACIGRIENKT